MGKYVKYIRFAAPLSAEELQKKFDELIKEGLEIVHYEEKKQETDRFYVTIICGKINEGEKQLLKN
jgi:hypothetical protein